jgi:hypothetical protein
VMGWFFVRKKGSFYHFVFYSRHEKMKFEKHP